MLHIEKQTPKWEFYAATRPYPGEFLSGDQAFFKLEKDAISFGIIDGLGHGVRAANISMAIEKYISAQNTSDVLKLVQDIHLEFKGSIGAVIGIAHLTNNGLLNYIGVGNISCRILGIGKQNTSLLSRDGVVGQRYQQLQLTQYQLQSCDRVMMFSDGISRSSLRKYNDFPPRSSIEFVNTIIQNFGKNYDDASFLYVSKRK